MVARYITLVSFSKITLNNGFELTNKKASCSPEKSQQRLSNWMAAHVQFYALYRLTYWTIWCSVRNAKTIGKVHQVKSESFLNWQTVYPCICYQRRRAQTAFGKQSSRNIFKLMYRHRWQIHCYLRLSTRWVEHGNKWWKLVVVDRQSEPRYTWSQKAQTRLYGVSYSAQVIRSRLRESLSALFKPIN